MSRCVYTGCNVLVIKDGHAQARHFHGDAHFVDTVYVFNINPRSEGQKPQGPIDYVLYLKEDYDYGWFATSPNLIIINTDCVYEVSDRAEAGLEEQETGTDSIDWNIIMPKLGFRYSDREGGWVERTKRSKEDKSAAIPTGDPGDTAGAAEFIDTDPEPF